MTDQEKIRKCAELMDIKVSYFSEKFNYWHADSVLTYRYWPLTNKAQALGLVERLGLRVRIGADRMWIVSWHYVLDGIDKDLCRAIVDCAAKMHSYELNWRAENESVR